MMESVHDDIWEQFQQRGVSLLMIFNSRGRILWSRGRKILGNTVYNGCGFSRTIFEDTLLKKSEPAEKEIPETVEHDTIDLSNRYLNIKAKIIQQIRRDLFMYIDSAHKESFFSGDREIFQILGKILINTSLNIEENKEFRGITGESREIIEIRNLMNTYSSMDEPLLISGETGTGKTYIAEQIHQLSKRKGKFMVIHAPSIPENLFESEVFGHKKGAFTNATTNKRGLVEEANAGTLLIDEITEVSFALQAKLLRFIETGKYTPLGETGEKISDARIIAATNRELHDAIEKKEFREDLYYRLSVFEIELPPLRRRKEDLKLLVGEKYAYLKNKQIGSGFWEALYNHDWPGNIRELNSVLKRAGVLNKCTIDGGDIEMIIKSSSRNRQMKRQTQGYQQILDDLKKGKSFWDAVRRPYMSREFKRSEVQALIDDGLKKVGGKYCELLKVLNVENRDYNRFMRFLYDQQLIRPK